VRAAALGLAIALWALPASVGAQHKVWRIAYLTGYSAQVDRPLQAAFRHGLKDLGYVEGRNIRLEIRHAAGQPQRMDALAQELAAGKPDIFIAGGGADAAVALRKVAGGAPIVMANVQDPLTSGLVKSLARPGGNITGMSDFHAASVTKRVELMHEAFPSMKVLGVLWNQDSKPSASQFKDVERAAARTGLRVASLTIRKPEDIDGALRKLKDERSAGLLLLGDYVLTTNMRRIASRAAEYRVPSAYTLRGYAEEGGLMSYGTDFQDLYRRSARFVDKILKGAKPADLPVEQPTKFQLVINLKTAKALGLAISPAFLVRADDVIQ
jgi:putative tryptophan/tyrosine transport system substrate-binding protein